MGMALNSISKKNVATFLQTHGVPRNSRAFIDYEMAKQLVFREKIIDPARYEVTNRWIQEYVGV